MDSGNAGKARDIALDVMTSLEDWQKCMEHTGLFMKIINYRL